MKIRSTMIGVWVFVLLLVVGLAAAAIKLFRQADYWADYSAHAALTAEFSDLLAAIPAEQIYPTSLSQLQLTFPDGGDASLLARFTYSSDGTSCTVRTVLHDREFARSYP